MKKRSRRHRKTKFGWTAVGKSVLLNSFSDEGRRRLSRRLVVAVGAFVVVWISFFDSHSLFKRLTWHQEHAELTAENAALEAEIERLEREVEKGLSNEMAEKIAREYYGMRRPGETVYRVEGGD